MRNSQSERDSLQVAPLALGKPNSAGMYYQEDYQQEMALPHGSEMTPPATLNDALEDPANDPESPPVFHNFLRAFYPFHPTYAMSDTSITLPLDEGDVILVHSIHTNGWADGTLLASGARGWLPTNYCEAYEPEDMINLLKALLNFWDLLRSSSINDQEIFGNQEFMKGIIAGVRFLLQRTNCLNRESSIVQRSERIRKNRKSLMSELSSLVKTAKRIQESQRLEMDIVDDVNNVVDEMVLKAFRIVAKGVRFLDVLEEDRRARTPATVTVMDTVAEESLVPCTPPADAMAFGNGYRYSANLEVASPGPVEEGLTSVTSSEPIDVANTFPLPQNKRLSSVSNQGASMNLEPNGAGGRVKRQSWSISHRVSLAGPATCSRPSHLVSERLNRSHDALLSHLGSFIGRLQYSSQSRPQLASAIKQCANAGGELLAVIDSVCSQSYSSSDALMQLRAALFQHIEDLVITARDTLINTASEEGDLIMPEDTSGLLTSAIGCVRLAGECIAKARHSIERVGDFEFEMDSVDLGIDLDMLDTAARELEQRRAQVEDAETVSVTESAQTNGSATPGPNSLGPMIDKPLPEVPTMDIALETLPRPPSSGSSSRPGSQNDEVPESMASSVSSIRPTITLPKLSTTLLPPEQPSPIDSSCQFHEYHASSSQFDSMIASSAGSSATYLSRDSEASVASQTSTRATTPDHTLVPRNQPSMSELSAATTSSQTEEVDEVESRLMEKTFAHELMFNREGQVTGGSLPALVERLTTHEAAPDAMFVSTFYLTFRLFCTPEKLAEALIDRFEYVGESPHLSGPVRLRVYNAFKGWLETHWKHQADQEALHLISNFAEQRLSSVLPQAGHRLSELCHRVSTGGYLVPRLVSSMGKTNTAAAHFIPPDTPVPQPSISKTQQNMLTASKSGGNVPSVLDLDPVEIARQLTVKQMNIFCSIQPDELLSSQWMKNGGVDAPNVKAMSSLSTDLSNLVADSILQHQEIKKRAAMIKQWIKVAHQCLELHNYDGLMAIICSLNSSTIGRLRKTWDLISHKRKEMLATLQRLIEPSQNNKVLRTRLHDHVPPCLPFLGMYLTDLTFVDIGNPATKQMSMGNETHDQRSSGMTVVNFDKHTRTAKIIGELQRFQIPYRLTEVPDMQDWLSLQISRVREGDQGKIQVTYYRKSLLLEPREAAARTPIEPTPTSTMVPSRGDLFGWMSRDRGFQNSTPAPV